MAFHWNQNYNGNILFSYSVFQSKSFKNLLKLFEEKSSKLLNWEHLFWHNSIARKYSKILYFQSSVKKRSNQSCCVEELTYPKKAEKSLLIMSGTLCNKSARGIIHELFVKSICIHTYCATLSLLETTPNTPFETWYWGSQQQSPLCPSKVHLVTTVFS